MSETKAQLKKIARYLLSPYFFLRGNFFIWYYVLNVRQRMTYNREIILGSEKDSEVQSVITQLRSNGYAISHIDSLMGKGTLTALRQYVDSLDAPARARKGKPFLHKLWEDDLDIDFANPFFKIIFSERILGIVNAYFGMYVKNYYSSLDITLPVPAGQAPVRSQRWHRDPEDLKLCKLFIYLSDVDSASGPLHYVAQSHHGGRWNGVAPQQLPLGSYPNDGVVEQVIPADDIRTITGTSGTVIFCDTAGLHRGGFSTNQQRLMFTTEYASSMALRPVRYRTVLQDPAFLGPRGRHAIRPVSRIAQILNMPATLGLKRGLYQSYDPI